MAAHPIVVVDHGRVEIPEELQSDPRYRDGARLQLVPVEASVDREKVKEVLASWNRLAGILAESDYDPNAELEREKQKELEDEIR
jgi:hypothetical protein